ncbi:MAG: AAA family ATPase [Blastocatellia bacterium]
MQRLQLKNYRCFRDLELTFHDRLTVLVAANGGGKTAVLDGVAVALRPFVDTMEDRSRSRGFDSKDIRLVLSPNGNMEQITPIALLASATFLGSSVRWNGASLLSGTLRSITGDDSLEMIAIPLISSNQEYAEGEGRIPPTFPLISYYGTGRLWSAGRRADWKKPRETAPNARHRGYAECLSSSSHYKVFLDWFRRFSYEARGEGHDELYPSSSPGRREEPVHDARRTLSVVRGATDIALAPSGWNRLEWDFAEDALVAHHISQGRLLVDTLSDGIRNMIGLVADIAHRAARLNPHIADRAALDTPGIVLIDEVDMHLHPAWQQVVLDSLQEAFPLLQFIVTTHSPQVLTTVKTENIRIFEDGVVHSATPGTYGAEAQRILESIFHVSPRPPKNPKSVALNEYLRLVDAREWESPRALELRKELDEWSQGHEPRLLAADLEIDNMKWEAGQ